MNVTVLDDTTDEEMQQWSDEMKRTATLTYIYESRDLAVLFNIDQLVIATKALNQEYPQTGSRID